MTTLDKVLVCIRDIACACFLIFGLLHGLEILPAEQLPGFCR